jgi:ATP-dependent Lhr-like helicase
MGLPDLFSRWFESRGWAPRPHQLALVDLARKGRSALLIAPTGGGKTLAGFLPSLIELTERRQSGQDLAYKKGQGELHTLYISPLKALATDIRRNLELPIAEMKLPVRAESRTGDTPQSRRLRSANGHPIC